MDVQVWDSPHRTLSYAEGAHTRNTHMPGEKASAKLVDSSLRRDASSINQGDRRMEAREGGTKRLREGAIRASALCKVPERET